MKPTLPHDPIQTLLAQPARSVEAQAWMRRAPAEALAWRGSEQETALHWLAMSDMSGILAALELGLDVNALDAAGRTPLDWLNDRLWMAVVDKGSPLGRSGRAKLLKQTEDLVPTLWGRGGRSSRLPGVLEEAQVWARAGAWPLLALLREEARLDGWRYRGEQGESVLHGWVLAPESPAKHAFLAQALELGLSPDEPDRQGRTPLWYAVDAWAADPKAWASTLRPAIKALIHAGAQVDQADDHGQSPAQMPLRYRLPPEVAEPLERVLFPDSTLSV